ncbi:hypothetical protein GCM10020256_62020 [Streptomyces thermocoprophilus]
MEVRIEQASFEAILPALGSGKYDVGASNFGVTDERRRTIDFVTYINDGQGFATRKDSDLSKVTDLKQLCGLNVATGAGTTFEATLEKNKHVCSDAGEKPYTVQTYSEQGAIWSSVQQGRSDVVMSTINGLRYAVAHQPGVKFLNEFHRLDVGFAFKKGTPLAPAFQAAVNKLIADGTYAKILQKWGDDRVGRHRVADLTAGDRVLSGRQPQQSQQSQQSQTSQQSRSRQQPSRFFRDHGPSYSLAQHIRQVQNCTQNMPQPAQKPRGSGGLGCPPPGPPSPPPPPKPPEEPEKPPP